MPNLASPPCATAQALGYIKAGTHTIHVFWDGVASYSSLRIKHVKLLSVSGSDANHNGIKDWAEAMIASESGLDNTNPVIGSYTSPLCLEGRDPYPAMTLMTNNQTNVLSPQATTDGRWYANVPLQAATQTVFRASYQNGALNQSRGLQWQQLGQVVKNELLDALCAMTPPPDGLGDVLTRMYRDQGQNDVIRDYAVQHLVAYDEQLGNQAERQTAQNVLWSALNETGNSIAGTALLGLERLSREDAQMDQGRIAQGALALANDNTAGELTHITAYQVCAQMNVQDALPTIKAAAQNSQTIPMQISAIGALGLLGGKDDLPLLQNLLKTGEERLQVPAQNAINRIEQRLQLQASAR